MIKIEAEEVQWCNLEEVTIHDLIIHGSRLAILVRIDKANLLAEIQYIDHGLPIEMIDINNDYLFAKAKQVTIVQ